MDTPVRCGGARLAAHRPAHAVAVVVRVLLRDELIAELGSVRALHAAVRSGAWTRVLTGAYADSPHVDLDARARAALLLMPGGAVLAGHSALWLCGVDVLPPGQASLEVLVARGRTVPRRRGVAARAGLLRTGDVGHVATVATLRPARAAVDLMRRLPLPDAVAVADAVQHASLCPRPQLGAELRLHERLAGVRSARRALELSSPLAESPPESRLRVALVVSGLVPVPQHEVRDAVGRLLARVDLAFPERCLALEYDGREVHTVQTAFVHDRRRQNALVAAGWRVLRFTSHDLRHPAQVVAGVRRALGGRGATAPGSSSGSA